MFDAALGESDRLPFTIGDLDPARGFVHVLDDTMLEIVLGTLDTVGGFAAYLRAKEAFIRGGHLGYAAGEGELLTLYLTHGSTTAHAFPVSQDGAKLIVLERHWAAFEASPARHAQRAANAISYAWNALIGTFETHFLAGTSEFRSHPELRDSEPALQLLAGETRTRRRYLASQLIELVQTPIPPGRPWNVRVIAAQQLGAPAYVFLTLSRRHAESPEHYRQQRRQAIEWYLMVTRHRHPAFDPIVGIATEHFEPGATRSEDLYVLRGEDWTTSMAAEARRLHEEWGLLKHVGAFDTKVVEYPIAVEDRAALRRLNAASNKRRGRDRNMPCPCQSGKKWKRCCGRECR
ncbi:MAG: SEC-C domain-containing protein [Gemmatimonas sp.]